MMAQLPKMFAVIDVAGTLDVFHKRVECLLSAGKISGLKRCLQRLKILRYGAVLAEGLAARAGLGRALSILLECGESRLRP
jgi:hypothetical protein